MHLADAFIQSDLQASGFTYFVSMWILTKNSALHFCALYLTHPSALTVVHTHLEQWAAIAAVPGSFVALLKALTSVMVSKVVHSPHDNSCRTRDSNPRPQVTSPTLYPLGHDCPLKL